MKEIEKLRKRETELAAKLDSIVTKREAMERELLPVITASIATHEQLAACRKAIASLALTHHRA